MKVSEILKILQEDGCQVQRQKGSHRQLRHPIKPGTVTVPGKPSHDLNPKTAASIFRQAGLKP